MAKVVNGHYYKVRKYKNPCELNINHNENFDDVVNDIRYACERAVKLGYHNDEKWLIVLVEHETTYDNEGIFCSSWNKENVVALYDNGNVIEY